MSNYDFTVPTLTDEQTDAAVEQLQISLDVLNDLALTLKHAHWNVKGANFISVHEMLDPQIDEVRDAVDEIAERIATLGGAPNGLSSSVLKTAKDKLPQYTILGRADALDHIKALDAQYEVIIIGLRDAVDKLDDADIMSSNILQDVVGNLEKFQWFLRSHIS